MTLNLDSLCNVCVSPLRMRYLTCATGQILFIRFTPTFQCANMKFKINWNKTVLNIFGLLAKLTIPNIRRFMSEINGVF